MAISEKKLRTLCCTVSSYQRGLDYARKNRVKILAVDGGRVRAMVEGSHDYYAVTFDYSEDARDLEDYTCDCPAYERYPGICKHIAAAVMYFQQQDGINSMLGRQTKTDRAASELLSRYKQRVLERIPALSAGGGKATLEATLEIDHLARVSLRVGSSRMYVVQNIESFVEHMRRHDTVALSKRFTLHHIVNSFTDESRPLLEFVMRYYKISLIAGSGYGYYSSFSQKRRMNLPAFIMDKFLEIYIGKKLMVYDGSATEQYAVTHANPPVAITVSADLKGGCILSCDSQFTCVQGGDILYMLDTREKIIYCCDAAYSAACASLFLSLEEGGGQLRFAKKDIPVMCSTVLNEVKPFLRLEADMDLQAYTPELKSLVYLDAPFTDSVTAKLVFEYGERRHSAFLPKQISMSYDIPGECRAENVVREYFSLPPDAAGILHIDGDSDEVYRLISEGLERISEVAEIYATPAFERFKVRPRSDVSVGVRLSAGLLEVDFDLGSLDIAELSEILASCRLAKKYHRLRDGSFLNLDDSAMTELAELAFGLDLSDQQIAQGHVSLPQSRSFYLDNCLKTNERIHYDRDGGFKRIIRSVRNVEDSDFPLPPALRPIMRNYQKTGYRWLRTIDSYHFGGILADDMGLGKTLQTLALLQSQQTPGDNPPLSLVVCPSSLVLNWESEAQRFTPDLRCASVCGTAAQRAQIIENCAGYDLLITSYDSLKRDVQLYADKKFRFVVLDEAQYIKNHSTQNAKAVKLLNAQTRFAMTGTPVENSLAELWSIFDFLMPGYLFSYRKFKQKLEEPIVKRGDDAASGCLRRLTKPFILRRLKKDVLAELPEKTETVLKADFGQEQRKLYNANLAQAKKELAAQMDVAPIAMLAALTRLRQLCCDPALVYEDYSDQSVKLDLCMDLVQNCVASGHRMLIFSQFTSMLKIIGSRLSDMGIDYYVLQGSTKSSDRLALVNAFNTGSTPVFLISLKAGGTGLNLTGADVVVHYDPWWNMSAQNQATDRAYRIGQKKSVQVYKLIVSETIEEKILKMQQSKAELADAIVTQDAGALVSMSREEILSLFE